MTVGAIAIGQNGEPIILLNDLEKKQVLPIWIGLLEARAISLAAHKVRSKRPLTHELLLSTIEQLGCNIKEVSIDSIENEAYVASIILGRAEDGAEKIKISARPSDAIAVAILAGSPIFVDGEILAQSSVAMDGQPDKEQKEFKEFIANLKASDFKSSENVELPDEDYDG